MFKLFLNFKHLISEVTHEKGARHPVWIAYYQIVALVNHWN